MSSGWDGGQAGATCGFAPSSSSSSSSPSLAVAESERSSSGGPWRWKQIFEHFWLHYIHKRVLNRVAVGIVWNINHNYGVHHLYDTIAIIEQLNSAQLEDLVQEGRWLVDVDRHGSLTGWISHCLIKVLQPGVTLCKQTHNKHKQQIKQVFTIKQEHTDSSAAHTICQKLYLPFSESLGIKSNLQNWQCAPASL